MIHRVRAVNERGSANLVHDDEFARRLGFRGGLVPGVTVYGYLAALPAELWGPRWLATGTMRARFLKPLYDGEEAAISAAEADGALDLEARNPAGEVCATGEAALGSSEPPPDPARYPETPLPVQPSGPAFLEGQALGAARAQVRLSDHGWPARLGNLALTANVALPPWIHVETRTRHLAPVHDGETLEVRALVAALWERRQHRFVELDALVLGETSKPVAHLRHVAIYELAQLR